MRESLLGGAALAALLPPVAWAGSPAVPMLLGPPPAGVACDIGPAYQGAVPAAAQAAGFTHCAANYDFTQPAYANPATWLDCKGATSPQWSFAYGNCAHITMVQDGGEQALQLEWDPSDYGTYGTATAIQTSGPGNPSTLAGALLTLPTGKYVEVVSRITPATLSGACTTTGCIYAASWAWGGNSDTDFVEWDYIEFYSQGENGAQLHPWNGASAGVDSIGEPHNVSGYDATQYNSYGMRTATDTAGDLSMCTYLNGTLIPGGGAYNCGTGSYSPVPLGRDFLVHEVGPQGSNPNFTGTADYLIRRETVWACPGYETGECYNTAAQVTNGGALTSSP